MEEKGQITKGIDTCTQFTSDRQNSRWRSFRSFIRKRKYLRRTFGHSFSIFSKNGLWYGKILSHNPNALSTGLSLYCQRTSILRHLSHVIENLGQHLDSLRVLERWHSQISAYHSAPHLLPSAPSCWTCQSPLSRDRSHNQSHVNMTQWNLCRGFF